MLRIAVLTLLISLGAVPAVAQDQERRSSHCIALVQDTPGIQFVHQASFGAPLEQFSVRLSYINHAMFLLETHGGQSAVTDYTGFLGTSEFVPDVVTMNNAHSSHWTSFPDPRIANVLPGWNPEGGPAEHHLDLGEILVRNVTTDIRSSFGGSVPDGNSIFIFEVAGLCIGHLGHLHHEPTDAQYAAIGRLDVVMAPVDGGMTVDLATMTALLKRLRSSIVIPMHWFGSGTLEVFLNGMSDQFAIERSDRPWLEVSLRSLPDRPTVVVLPPLYLQDEF